MLEQVACPNCQTPINLRKVHAEGAYVECPACGGQFVLQGHVCPNCGTYHAQEVTFCRQCGLTMTRRCPQCETLNWIGDEYCVKCGVPLDIIEMIAQRLNQGTQSRLAEQMDTAQQLKQAEETASQVRLARMQEEERQWQLEVQQRLITQHEQEQKMLTGVLIASGIIFFIIMVTVIIGIVLQG